LGSLGTKQEIGGEGKDLNLRVVLPTATSKLVTALANGDLSVHFDEPHGFAPDDSTNGKKAVTTVSLEILIVRF
jgi:hypothetical protein